MIKPINEQHPIFLSTEYQNDIVPFNLIEVIKFSAKLMVSDEKSFICCSMQFPSVPAWIWTTENISKESIDELTCWLVSQFQKETDFYFVAKPAIASEIIKAFEKNIHLTKSIVHMEGFECRKLIPAKNIQAEVEKPNKNDLAELSQFCHNFEKECFSIDISEDEAMDNALKLLENQKTYIVRADGKAVAMAKSSRETNKHIAVSGVYTLPEYRQKGYAAAVVAHICSLILSEGKIPLLYTDLANPYSNKAYVNIGFAPCGKVDEVHLKWECLR